MSSHRSQQVTKTPSGERARQSKDQEQDTENAYYKFTKNNVREQKQFNDKISINFSKQTTLSQNVNANQTLSNQSNSNQKQAVKSAYPNKPTPRLIKEPMSQRDTLFDLYTAMLDFNMNREDRKILDQIFPNESELNILQSKVVTVGKSEVLSLDDSYLQKFQRFILKSKLLKIVNMPSNLKDAVQLLLCERTYLIQLVKGLIQRILPHDKPNYFNDSFLDFQFSKLPPPQQLTPQALQPRIDNILSTRVSPQQAVQINNRIPSPLNNQVKEEQKSSSKISKQLDSSQIQYPHINYSGGMSNNSASKNMLEDMISGAGSFISQLSRNLKSPTSLQTPKQNILEPSKAFVQIQLNQKVNNQNSTINNLQTLRTIRDEKKGEDLKHQRIHGKGGEPEFISKTSGGFKHRPQHSHQIPFTTHESSRIIKTNAKYNELMSQKNTSSKTDGNQYFQLNQHYQTFQQNQIRPFLQIETQSDSDDQSVNIKDTETDSEGDQRGARNDQQSSKYSEGRTILSMQMNASLPKRVNQVQIDKQPSPKQQIKSYIQDKNIEKQHSLHNLSSAGSHQSKLNQRYQKQSSIQDDEIDDIAKLFFSKQKEQTSIPTYQRSRSITQQLQRQTSSNQDEIKSKAKAFDHIRIDPDSQFKSPSPVKSSSLINHVKSTSQQQPKQNYPLDYLNSEQAKDLQRETDPFEIDLNFQKQQFFTFEPQNFEAQTNSHQNTSNQEQPFTYIINPPARESDMNNKKESKLNYLNVQPQSLNIQNLSPIQMSTERKNEDQYFQQSLIPVQNSQNLSSKLHHDFSLGSSQQSNYSRKSSKISNKSHEEQNQIIYRENTYKQNQMLVDDEEDDENDDDDSFDRAQRSKRSKKQQLQKTSTIQESPDRAENIKSDPIVFNKKSTNQESSKSSSEQSLEENKNRHSDSYDGFGHYHQDDNINFEVVTVSPIGNAINNNQVDESQAPYARQFNAANQEGIFNNSPPEQFVLRNQDTKNIFDIHLNSNEESITSQNFLSNNKSEFNPNSENSNNKSKPYSQHQTVRFEDEMDQEEIKSRSPSSQNLRKQKSNLKNKGICSPIGDKESKDANKNMMRRQSTRNNQMLSYNSSREGYGMIKQQKSIKRQLTNSRTREQQEDSRGIQKQHTRSKQSQLQNQDQEMKRQPTYGRSDTQEERKRRQSFGMKILMSKESSIGILEFQNDGKDKYKYKNSESSRNRNMMSEGDINSNPYIRNDDQSLGNTAMDQNMEGDDQSEQFDEYFGRKRNQQRRGNEQDSKQFNQKIEDLRDTKVKKQVLGFKKAQLFTQQDQDEATNKTQRLNKGKVLKKQRKESHSDSYSDFSQEEEEQKEHSEEEYGNEIIRISNVESLKKGQLFKNNQAASKAKRSSIKNSNQVQQRLTRETVKSNRVPRESENTNNTSRSKPPRPSSKQAELPPQIKQKIQEPKEEIKKPIENRYQKQAKAFYEEDSEQKDNVNRQKGYVLGQQQRRVLQFQDSEDSDNSSFDENDQAEDLDFKVKIHEQPESHMKEQKNGGNKNGAMNISFDQYAEEQEKQNQNVNKFQKGKLQTKAQAQNRHQDKIQMNSNANINSSANQKQNTKKDGKFLNFK